MAGLDLANELERLCRLAALSLLTLPMALVGGVLAAFMGSGVISLGSLVGFFTVMGIAPKKPKVHRQTIGIK